MLKRQIANLLLCAATAFPAIAADPVQTTSEQLTERIAVNKMRHASDNSLGPGRRLTERTLIINAPTSPIGIFSQRPVNDASSTALPAALVDCLLHAASQYIGSRITSTDQALRALKSLARIVHEPGTTGNIANEHALYVVCPLPDGAAVKLLTPEGSLEDDPESDSIISAYLKATTLAKMVGMYPASQSIAAERAGLGEWPSLITIGPEKQEPLLGAFRIETRTISMRSGVTETIAPSIWLHEAAHYVLGTAPRLNSIEARRRFFGSPVVRLLNETYAYSMQFAAAYAGMLQGDQAVWRVHDNAGVKGTTYRSMILKAAEDFPDLKQRLRSEGRLPDAFLARIFAMLAAEPTAFDLQKLRYRPGYIASIDEADEILPFLHFLDAGGRDRMKELIEKTTWFVALKQGKQGPEIVEAVKGGEASDSKAGSDATVLSTTQLPSGDLTKPIRAPVIDARRFITTDQVLAKARQFIETGDVLAARAILADRAAANDARALFALAETYDANQLLKWNAKADVKANQGHARSLYEAALKAGIADAQSRLESLK